MKPPEPPRLRLGQVAEVVAEARGHVGEPLAGVDAVGALVHDDDLVEQRQHVVLGGERPQGGDAVVGAVVGAHDDRGAAVGRGGRDGPAGVVEHQLVVVGDDLDPEPAAVEEAVERRREAHVLGGGVVHRERARDPVGVRRPQQQRGPAPRVRPSNRTSRGRRPALPVARGEAAEVGVGADVAVRADAEVPPPPLRAPAQDLDVELVGDLRERGRRTARGPPPGVLPRPPARRRGGSRAWRRRSCGRAPRGSGGAPGDGWATSRVGGAGHGPIREATRRPTVGASDAVKVAVRWLSSR